VKRRAQGCKFVERGVAPEPLVALNQSLAAGAWDAYRHDAARRQAAVFRGRGALVRAQRQCVEPLARQVPARGD